jgi:N-acetylglucosaminyl-diphospho-decaprenol L-rhamnosyltransferase
MADIGIVVVTYNSAAHIGACLEAAQRTGAEIIVVDNASSDNTRDEIARSGARLLANQRNRGFAAAVNQGIRALDTPYVLLLNPDAVLQTGLDALRACCDKPMAAGAGGKLLHTSGASRGAPQAGFMVRRFPTPRAVILEALGINRLWPRNPVNWQFRCLAFDYDAEQQVDQPAGAFLMIRRDVWEQLGGFDERFYPLWFEDVDFAQRATARGYRMFYTPLAVAKHTGAHSMLNMPLEIRAYYWYGSCLRYSAGHFRPWSTRAIALAVVAGSLARMLVGSISQRSLGPIVAYYRVLGLAGHYLFCSPKHGAGPASYS